MSAAPPMENLILILLIAALAWFWVASMNARDAAIAAGRAACRRYGVQLLDESVALAKLRIRRHWSGRLRFYREYSFEFSATGEERSGGVVRLLGVELQGADLYLDATPPSPVAREEEEAVEVVEIEPVKGAKIIDFRPRNPRN